MDEKKVREVIGKLQVGINGKREKIKHNKAFFPKQDNSQLEEDIDVYETAIKALEKQLPKKPMYEGDGCDRQGNIILDTWICPSCGVNYEVDYDDYDYCYNCGQKIDWLE